MITFHQWIKEIVQSIQGAQNFLLAKTIKLDGLTIKVGGEKGKVAVLARRIPLQRKNTHQ